jgi:hypothetical protein
MSMGNDVTKLYKAETGKDALGAWGNDDTENDMYCYVEGPTMDYVRWLEGRASRTRGSANTPTNMSSAPCPKCGAMMREIFAYMSHQYCPCCDRVMPVTAHVD